MTISRNIQSVWLWWLQGQE